jgi:hypothetical protein
MRPALMVVAVSSVFILFSGPARLYAQASDRSSFDAGGHISVLRLSEFDTTDAGVGANATWHITPALALGGSLTWFNGSESSALAHRVANQTRVLGLAGGRYGIHRGGVELFARGHAGFLRFAPFDGAVCVAVTTVPLPLECLIAAGYTAFATDLGGGVAMNASEHLQIRVEAGDLLVRYGMQAYRASGEPTDGFTSHNVQVSSAISWRF